MSPGDEIKFVLSNAPRLMKVAGATAISFALWEGVNRALLESKTNTDRREIAHGYRENCSFTAVTRLAVLLDSDPKQISFQTLYRRLQSDTLVTAILADIDGAMLSTGAAVENARYAIELFLKTYRSIDWQDLHGRLIHFRNRGVAHLTPHKIEKRVTYGELETLCRDVAIMGECMEPFSGGEVPLRQDEIKDYVERAFAIWRDTLR